MVKLLIVASILGCFVALSLGIAVVGAAPSPQGVTPTATPEPTWRQLGVDYIPEDPPGSTPVVTLFPDPTPLTGCTIENHCSIVCGRQYCMGGMLPTPSGLWPTMDPGGGGGIWPTPIIEEPYDRACYDGMWAEIESDTVRGWDNFSDIVVDWATFTPGSLAFTATKIGTGNAFCPSVGYTATRDILGQPEWGTEGGGTWYGGGGDSTCTPKDVWVIRHSYVDAVYSKNDKLEFRYWVPQGGDPGVNFVEHWSGPVGIGGSLYGCGLDQPAQSANTWFMKDGIEYYCKETGWDPYTYTVVFELYIADWCAWDGAECLNDNDGCVPFEPTPEPLPTPGWGPGDGDLDPWEPISGCSEISLTEYAAAYAGPGECCICEFEGFWFTPRPSDTTCLSSPYIDMDWAKGMIIGLNALFDWQLPYTDVQNIKGVSICFVPVDVGAFGHPATVMVQWAVVIIIFIAAFNVFKWFVSR